MIEGADVSVYQQTTPDLSALGFLFVKASEGYAIDPMYSHHMTAAKAAGKVTAAYCFGRDDVAVADQVATFLRAAAAAPPDLFALDVERANNGRVMPLAMVQAFVRAIQGSGRRIGLYASESGYPEAGQDWRWIANYIPGATFPAGADFWQYNDVPFDLDRWRGDGASLQTFARGKPDMPGIVYRFTPGPLGVATVSVDGASLIIASSHVLIAVPKGQRRRVYGHIVMTPSLDAQLGWTLPATGDRVDGYLIGEIAGTPAGSPGVQAAILLSDNATFTADAADCSAARAEVKAAALAAVSAIQ